MKFEYFENTNANIADRSYTEIRDDDICELVPEVEITKLVSLDSQ